MLPTNLFHAMDKRGVMRLGTRTKMLIYLVENKFIAA